VMTCSNCVDSEKAADEYILQIRGRNVDTKSINIMLCTICANEILSIDWINELPVQSETE
jgi:hypothetical protein